MVQTYSLKEIVDEAGYAELKEDGSGKRIRVDLHDFEKLGSPKTMTKKDLEKVQILQN